MHKVTVTNAKRFFFVIEGESFSGVTHNPSICCVWGRRPAPHNMTQSQKSPPHWSTVVFHWAVLSVKRGPHSKVWLCHSWQGDDWRHSSHVVPVNSPGLFLPEPDEDDGGVEVICRQRKQGGGGVSSVPHNTHRLASSFQCLSFQQTAESNKSTHLLKCQRMPLSIRFVKIWFENVAHILGIL